MREVFTSSDFTEVGYYKSILDEAGIVTFIENENTANPAMAGAAFSPSLCVVDDADFDRAVALLKAQQSPGPVGAVEWTCPQCSEKNPGNFEICWKCSSPRPGAQPSSAGA